MTAEKNTVDTEEAREMLAEILASLDETAQWCATNAAAALSQLQDKWRHTCEQAEGVDTEPFRQQCDQLLADCAVFQNQVSSKVRHFTETTQDRLPIIQELAGDEPLISSLFQEVAARWNDTEHPQLMFLYEKSEELETSIRNLMAG